MGIGINNAFQFLEYNYVPFLKSYQKLFDRNQISLNLKTEINNLIEQKNQADLKKITKMANFQVETIFLESFCSFSIFFHPKFDSSELIASIDPSHEFNDDFDDGWDFVENNNFDHKNLKDSSEITFLDPFHIDTQVYLKNNKEQSITQVNKQNMRKYCRYFQK